MKFKRDSAVKESFIKYLEEDTDERFWQALRNWSGYSFILASGHHANGTKDTFYLENQLPERQQHEQ